MSLKQYKLNFVIYDITPGIYKIKDFSEAVYTMGDHEGSIQIEYDVVSMKTKLTFKHIGTLRFDKKSFFFIQHYQGLRGIGIINLIINFILMGMV